MSWLSPYSNFWQMAMKDCHIFWIAEKVSCYHWPNKFWCTGTKPLASWESRFKMQLWRLNYLFSKHHLIWLSLRTSDFSAFWMSMARRLLWECTSTDCTVYDSTCKLSFPWQEIVYAHCCPVFLLKMLHNIFGHKCDFFFFWSFAACLPGTVLHDLLSDISSGLNNVVKWNHTPRYLH